MSEEELPEGVRAAAVKSLAILKNDREKRLLIIDRYLRGDHPEPYMPDSADAEYKLLAQRAISNRMPLLIDAPTQALYVEDFRTSAQVEDGGGSAGTERISDAWDHFERSRLAARQSQLYRSAFSYGHSFLLAEKQPDGKSFARLLSPLRTVALYEDPANDIDPLYALHVTRWPGKAGKDGTAVKGRARLWDETHEHEVTWETDDKPTVTRLAPHGAHANPVTRFTPFVDLEGRTVGLIEPMMVIQDRINQTVFDLLVAQTGGSFNTRWATGMAPPIKRDENGDPILKDGQYIPLPFQINGKTFLMNENPDGEFGSIPGTPLKGYIEAIENVYQEWASLSQIPPHHTLGKIANIGADALRAAETSFARKNEMFRHSFGESWERHFRIVASIEGTRGSEDVHGECVWRDMESASMNQYADGLSKLREGLEIPARGLWSMVPGVTATQLREWERLYDEEPERAVAEAVLRSSGTRTSNLNRRPEPELPQGERPINPSGPEAVAV